MTKKRTEESLPSQTPASGWRHFFRTRRVLLRLVLTVAVLLVAVDAFVSQRSLQHLLVGHTAMILLIVIAAAVIEWLGSE
ncbi:hypothetical protein HPT27_12985 [Permianibacter sp. IMCC34836]|uniref:hypothetical protein n=1 Tax=Permianibacter fluminis TaxID=2738515 RepID=UPI0015533981|nr:hypothetical protein [Permianibacter fluminis]NQD37939.1 hypothetical protein [Permianibacter fluminis]